MLQYFQNFIESFLGIESALSIPIATILAVSCALCVIYLLTKLVFPKDTIVKKSVFILIWIACIMVILSTYNVYPITIIQASSSLGVLV